MLVVGQALDAAVAAVVVGNQQALLGDHLTGAAAAEMDDGVFEGSLVDGIDFLGGELAACGLEVFSVELFQERQKPHSFIGKGAGRDGQGRHKC